METAFKVTHKNLRVMCWNCEKMGLTSPLKITWFLRYVEIHKPHVICLQETSSRLIKVKGYNHYLCKNVTNSLNGGAAIYVQAELGTAVQVPNPKPNVAEINLLDWGLTILNIYMAPVLKSRVPEYDAMI